MKKHALICEDSLTTAYCIQEMLKKLNYDSDIVSTAEDALKSINERIYDLMTLDIVLPDKNGLDLAREIKNLKLEKKLPIIIISASKQEGENSELQNNNISYWLEKSFDINAFEETIDKVTQEKSKVEVLHIENDDDIINLISITLEDIANITYAKTLADAKQKIESKEFDLIILDYVFPEGTSDKLLPSIKSGINKKTKIIMFSAYEESRIIKNYVDKIFIKTNISFDEFKQCVANIVKTDD